MPVHSDFDVKNNSLIQIANLMAVAARTAPKARGNDNLEIIIATGDTIKELSDCMKKMSIQYSMPFFNRDAENILQSPVVIIFGTTIKAQGIKKCGMCGHGSCEGKEKFPETPCVFNTHDLGLAIGSAASVAAMHHADNRVMYTIGQAAMELGLFNGNVKVSLGMPLSATAKNPFFDRPTL